VDELVADSLANAIIARDPAAGVIFSLIAAASTPAPRSPPWPATRGD
jgi:hypothetical protein